MHIPFTYKPGMMPSCWRPKYSSCIYQQRKVITVIYVFAAELNEKQLGISLTMPFLREWHLAKFSFPSVPLGNDTTWQVLTAWLTI